jgi:DNA-directed RNA polymerase subunit RPC12/RpoP
MAMAIKCANCGGHFTQSEVQQRKPPRYPHALTARGQQTLADNTARGGEQPQCPACGNRTLLVA